MNIFLIFLFGMVAGSCLSVVIFAFLEMTDD